MTSRRFRAMDPSDVAWSAVQTSRYVGGLNLPPTPVLRRRLSAVLDADPGLATLLEPVSGQVRTVTRSERQWFDEQVLVDKDQDTKGCGQTAVRLAEPLGALPFRLELRAESVHLQVSHAALDGWSSLALLASLLDPAADETHDLPWSRASRSRRDVLVFRQLLAGPATAARAWRSRGLLNAGSFEPDAGRSSDLDVRTEYSATASGLPARVREVRNQRCPEVSIAAILQVACRRVLAAHVGTPQAGTEVLFDLRPRVRGAEAMIGNWSNGVYVTPDDESRPESVTRELRHVARSGVPLLAHAAGRVRNRMRWRKPWRSMVAAPSGAPRMAFSYLNRPDILNRLPWVQGEESLVVGVRPNGLDGLTVSVCEVGDRFWTSISFHDSRWDADQVRSAIGGMDDELRAFIDLNDEVTA